MRPTLVKARGTRRRQLYKTLFCLKRLRARSPALLPNNALTLVSEAGILTGELRNLKASQATHWGETGSFENTKTQRGYITIQVTGMCF